MEQLEPGARQPAGAPSKYDFIDQIVKDIPDLSGWWLYDPDKQLPEWAQCLRDAYLENPTGHWSRMTHGPRAEVLYKALNLSPVERFRRTKSEVKALRRLKEQAS